MSKLFSELTVGGVTFKNRAWVSPMCQYSAVEGVIQDWHAVHYGSLITGGAGLVMVEASAVSAEGRITPRCAGIWTDQQAQVWAEVPRFAQRFGVKTGIQLAHAGRKGSTNVPWDKPGSVAPSAGGWQTIAPSAVAFDSYAAPREMTLDEIEELKGQFAAAAERALSAGFDVIEIHAAHGYLLHEFLSPISNKRSDEYGGSFENRIRFLLKVVEVIRSVIPAGMPLFLRTSSHDWIDGGWDTSENSALAKILLPLGVDLIEVLNAAATKPFGFMKFTPGPGVGGHCIPVDPHYLLDSASRLEVELPVLNSAI